MNDLDDGKDEILDTRTVEDELKQVIASLKLRYPDTVQRLKSREFQLIRERLELIEGKIRAQILLSKYL